MNSALYGGVAFLSGEYTLLLIESPSDVVLSNKAYYGGFAYVEKGANFTASNIIFRTHYASEGGVAYLIDNAKLQLTDNI